MADYAPLTVDKLHSYLLRNEVILRKSDIERIIGRIERKYSGTSEIVRFERAYAIAERYERWKIRVHRKSKAVYTGAWDGVNTREPSPV